MKYILSNRLPESTRAVNQEKCCVTAKRNWCVGVSQHESLLEMDGEARTLLRVKVR